MRSRWLGKHYLRPVCRCVHDRGVVKHDAHDQDRLRVVEQLHPRPPGRSSSGGRSAWQQRLAPSRRKLHGCPAQLAGIWDTWTLHVDMCFWGPAMSSGLPPVQPPGTGRGGSPATRSGAFGIGGNRGGARPSRLGDAAAQTA